MDRHLQALEALASKLRVKYGPDDALSREVVTDLQQLEGATRASRPAMPAPPDIARRLSWRIQDRATRGAPL